MADTNHSQTAGIHPGAYHQSTDPLTVGAGRLWVDTSSGPPYALKLRNAGDTGWDAVGSTATAPTFTWKPVSADYAILTTDTGILVTAATVDVNVTAPTAVGCTSRFTIKNKPSSTHNVLLQTTSTQTVDEVIAPITILPGDSLTIMSDNANYFIE